MNKALVTGSSGHLGEAMMRILRARGIACVGLDRKPGAYTDRVGSIGKRSLVDTCLSGVDVVFHTATLHKPHVATHSKRDFVDTNISGTLTLLEAARDHRIDAFIYTSTTSVYGDALRPGPEMPAAWITEDVRPIARNIYGVTKAAAEDMCELFARKHKLPCLVLKTSRFFPEADDNRERREGFADANLKVNELLYRRVDLEDVVEAHLLAAQKAKELPFGRYIISATSPLHRQDVQRARSDLPALVRETFPHYENIYAKLGWRMLPGIDRIYVNAAARRDLGWEPRWTFAHALEHLAVGESAFSELSRVVGKKGYHETVFAEGPYPVEE
ncbi:MAG: NAD-dependent epimerase/dehydratase family protein [Opitutales bacterium]